MKHVIVPLDGSELAGAVVPVAQTLALSTGATLNLVTVEPTATPLGSAHAAAGYLERAADALRAAGVSVQTNVRVGEPATAIVEWAIEQGADAIVMATHGRTGLVRALMGSVAEGVLRASPVPVLLLHPGARRVAGFKTIVVPVDGSPGAAFALTAATPLARTTGARMVLVRASVPLPLWIYDPTLGIDTGAFIDRTWDEEERQAAEDYAESIATRLRRVGLTADGYGVSGLPARAIVACADLVDADLIVMSTHARDGVARARLGSVADEVVRQSRRPVLLVRRNAAPHGLASPLTERSFDRLLVDGPG
jgi:nucleotide-binding universal stress UspA family protein